MAFYGLFNTNLENLLRDLVTAYPDIQELKRIKSAIILAKSINPKTPQKIFKTYVNDLYRTQIIAKDETFFLEKHSFDGVKENYMGFIDIIKMCWKDMDIDNQNVVWKYMHALIALSDKCCLKTT